jgi:UDP-N-acetyl-D-glucosamine dehydrogenase
MDSKEKKVIEIVNQKHELAQAILSKKCTIGIMGLGYVGLPLARAVVSQGYNCIGFDKNIKRIEKLNTGQTYIKTLSNEDIVSLNKSSKFFPTTNEHDIAKMDVILICVPTPLTKNREPDMNYVSSATKTIASQLRKGQLIILESTTYPGTTQELLSPMLEQSGLKIGKDIYLAYSPEREDPGNVAYNTSTIPKVVGADDDDSRELATTFYKQIITAVAEVSTSATAEAVKLTENIFRFVNIALVNELKCIFSKMDIDIWEVIDAAKTKPFGYMPFYPGPGLGGHCIPIDPFYLTWRAREFGMPTQLVELSGNINKQMGDYVIEKLRKEMDLRFGKGLRNSKILVIGVAYKKMI